jgi:hypothetical protein
VRHPLNVVRDPEMLRCEWLARRENEGEQSAQGWATRRICARRTRTGSRAGKREGVGNRKTHPSEKRRLRHPLNVVRDPETLRCEWLARRENGSQQRRLSLGHPPERESVKAQEIERRTLLRNEECGTR